MKKIQFLFMIVCLIANVTSYVQANTVDSSKQVSVYYFHYTQRCKTCVELEATAKLSVENLYASQVQRGEYVFKSFNIDDLETKELQKKYDIAGQTLLIVCGEKKIDITDQGFSNAQNFEGMKTEIKKAVNNVLINDGSTLSE